MPGDSISRPLACVTSLDPGPTHPPTPPEGHRTLWHKPQRQICQVLYSRDLHICECEVFLDSYLEAQSYMLLKINVRRHISMSRQARFIL
jgi:hypothetical protein